MDDPTWMPPADLRREVVRLRNAIRWHRHTWDTTVGRWDPRRDDANDDLWSLLDAIDGKG